MTPSCAGVIRACTRTGWRGLLNARAVGPAWMAGTGPAKTAKTGMTGKTAKTHWNSARACFRNHSRTTAQPSRASSHASAASASLTRATSGMGGRRSITTAMPSARAAAILP